MRLLRLKHKIAKNIRYGVLCTSIDELESHHESKAAAARRAKRQTRLWKSKRNFEVVQIIN